MAIEFEAKFLNINTSSSVRRLAELGAKKEFSERLMKRCVFDLPKLQQGKENAWLRLRDEGEKITATFKNAHSKSLGGMEEIEIVVDESVSFGVIFDFRF